MKENKPDNKIYEALMVERETRQKFKKLKESFSSTKFNNTEFLEYLFELLDRQSSLT